MARLMTLSVIPNVYADAYLADETGRLLFLSVWGRDTALQEFLARLQLPRSENGIREFVLRQESLKVQVQVPNVDELEKITSKTPNHTVFGTLTQLWVYDKRAVRPDPANQRALMIYNPEVGPVDPWPLLKTVCPLPLLDDWKAVWLEQAWQQGWLKALDNGVGVAGLSIELDDNLEPMMTEMIQRGVLTLPKTA